MNLAMFGLPSNMKSSSHKTWQTSLLFFKTFQMQNLKRKKWGGYGILCPPRLKKWGDTSPVSPTKLRSCPGTSNLCSVLAVSDSLELRFSFKMVCGLGCSPNQQNTSLWKILQRRDVCGRDDTGRQWIKFWAGRWGWTTGPLTIFLVVGLHRAAR